MKPNPDYVEAKYEEKGWIGIPSDQGERIQLMNTKIENLQRTLRRKLQGQINPDGTYRIWEP